MVYGLVVTPVRVCDVVPFIHVNAHGAVPVKAIDTVVLLPIQIELGPETVAVGRGLTVIVAVPVPVSLMQYWSCANHIVYVVVDVGDTGIVKCPFTESAVMLPSLNITNHLPDAVTLSLRFTVCPAHIVVSKPVSMDIGKLCTVTTALSVILPLPAVHIESRKAVT